jgi:putative flippase GtrA
VNKFIIKHALKLRFLVAGGFNTFVGLSSYPILFFALEPYHVHYISILVLSHALCVPIAFMTNKYLVFRTRGNHIQEFLKFSTFYNGYLLFNLLLLPFIVEVSGLHPAITQSIISVGIIVSSFFWHSKISFARGK